MVRATAELFGKLRETILEIHRGNFACCRSDVWGEGTKTGSYRAGTRGTGSARLPDGPRGPHRARAGGISLHPECGKRHAEHPEKRGASRRNAGSAWDRNPPVADHGTRARGVRQVDRAG